MENGILKALVKDNIRFKIIIGCVKVTAENDQED
jgi:hypothetical protein